MQLQNLSTYTVELTHLIWCSIGSSRTTLLCLNSLRHCCRRAGSYPRVADCLPTGREMGTQAQAHASRGEDYLDYLYEDLFSLRTSCLKTSFNRSSEQNVTCAAAEWSHRQPESSDTPQRLGVRTRTSTLRSIPVLWPCDRAPP